MQHVTKINNILADVIRGKKGDELYTQAHANKDIHDTFNGELESDIITFKNEDGEMTAIDFLINECCIEHGVSLEQIKGKSRKRDCILARHTAMYLLEKHKAGTLNRIGKIFNGRDHSTVLHAKNAMLNLIDTDIQAKRRIDRIEENLLKYMGKTETILTTTNMTIPKPPFNVNMLIEEIKAMMRKSPLVTDREILNNYKIERNACEKILKMIEKIEAKSILEVATAKELVD